LEPTIKNLLKKYNIHPLKKLGQNFLIDENVLKKIIESTGLNSNDTVLEIGPGLGILTLELAKRVKKVIAIEKDGILCQVLRDILKTQKVSNVEVINEDILKTRYKIQDTRYKLVANLPYYITSPVIRKFLEAEQKPKAMVLMVQKEVGQRIMAKPPHMNLLAISVQFYAEPEIITYVSKKSFCPAPKVDSAIIKIIPKQIPKIDTEKFFKLVKAGFSSKRKFLISNLSREFPLKAGQPWAEKIKKEKLKTLLEELNINPKVRAENLSIDDWTKIYETIK